jgi:hypothetical protein
MTGIETAVGAESPVKVNDREAEQIAIRAEERNAFNDSGDSPPAEVRKLSKNGAHVFAAYDGSRRVSPFVSTEAEAQGYLDSLIRVEQARAKAQHHIQQGIAQTWDDSREYTKAEHLDCVTPRVREVKFFPFTVAITVAEPLDTRRVDTPTLIGPRRKAKPVPEWQTEDSWGDESSQHVTLDNYRTVLASYDAKMRTWNERTRIEPPGPHKVTLLPLEKLMDDMRGEKEHVRLEAKADYDTLINWTQLAVVPWDGKGFTWTLTPPADVTDLADEIEQERKQARAAQEDLEVREAKGGKRVTKSDPVSGDYYIRASQFMSAIEAYSVKCPVLGYVNEDEQGLRLDANRETFFLLTAARERAGEAWWAYDRVADLATCILSQLYGERWMRPSDRLTQYRANPDLYRRMKNWEWNGGNEEDFDAYLGEQFRLLEQRTKDADKDDATYKAMGLTFVDGDDDGGEDGTETGYVTEEFAIQQRARYTYDRSRTRKRYKDIGGKRITLFNDAARKTAALPNREAPSEFDPIIAALREADPDSIPLYLDRAAGMAYKAIGQRHGVNEDTARMRLSRALKSLFPKQERVKTIRELEDEFWAEAERIQSR